MAKRRKSLRSLSKAQLERVATRMLAKSGFYKKPDRNTEQNPVNADMIAAHGGLKATWIGRP